MIHNVEILGYVSTLGGVANHFCRCENCRNNRCKAKEAPAFITEFGTEHPSPSSPKSLSKETTLNVVLVYQDV